MKSYFTGMLCAGFLMLCAGCTPQPGKREGAAAPQGPEDGQVDAASGDLRGSRQVEIFFPRKGEQLVSGRTYTLKWKGGPDSLSIFLIDSALESAGASVSISDRVYQVENTGSFEYTVPARLEPGTYKFTIGPEPGPYFRIISP